MSKFLSDKHKCCTCTQSNNCIDEQNQEVLFWNIEISYIELIKNRIGFWWYYTCKAWFWASLTPKSCWSLSNFRSNSDHCSCTSCFSLKMATVLPRSSSTLNRKWWRYIKYIKKVQHFGSLIINGLWCCDAIRLSRNIVKYSQGTQLIQKCWKMFGSFWLFALRNPKTSSQVWNKISHFFHRVN